MATYSWETERQFVAERIRDFYQTAASSRRAIKDPFKDVVMIKCAIANCKARWGIEEKVWKSFEQCDPRIAFESLKAILSRHEHAFAEVGLREKISGGYARNSGSHFFFFSCGAHTTFLCASCRAFCPFPSTDNPQWNHECANRIWSLELPNSKTPTLRWNQSATIWVLEIPYHNILQEALAAFDPNKLVRDKKNHVWLVSDTIVQDVHVVCQRWLKVQWFKRPAARPGSQNQKGVTIVSGKAIAANELLVMLPPEVLNKAYRVICASLHPDAQPENKKAEFTELFQHFQQQFNKWSKA